MWPFLAVPVKGGNLNFLKKSFITIIQKKRKFALNQRRLQSAF